MITIKIDFFNITQALYDETINNLNLNRLKCPKCGQHSLSVHAYYTRRVKTIFGVINLRVLRVICSGCGSTHAILLSCIVPYSSIELHHQIRIIEDDDIKGLINEIGDIDESNIYYIKRNFHKHFKQRLLSMNICITDDSLVFNCFKYFKRQFMQIKCTSNLLFS